MTEKEVLEIRAIVAKGKYYGLITELAKKYGIARRNINKIISRESWSHI